jgi:glucosamine--fructose-6-phosphate aminotransferase (isomerizing)
MCGIFGCILCEGKAAPIIHAALKRLEYRGYDSVGLATISSGKIIIKKDKGKISEINKELNLDEMEGEIGIGHTRWATHGIPSEQNAHPHTDCEGKIAIVHNGIIENFLELRKELEDDGHKIKSETDSELIAHLIEHFMEKRESFKEAVRLTAKRLEGSFAILAISIFEHDKIICVRKESPLVIGFGETGIYCASDITAFLPLTKKALIMEEEELAVIKHNKIQLLKFKTGNEVKRDMLNIDWSLDDASKEGYPHFTLKEINEQISSIKNTLRIHPIYHKLMVSKILEHDKLYLIGCGTSYHACIAGTYLFSKLANIDSRASVASEFMAQYGDLVNSKTAILALSQSGETADTLEALKKSKSKKATILSITNVIGSSITRISDIFMTQNSGPEIGVAATKTFTAQLAILSKLALTMAYNRKKISQERKEELELELEKVPFFINDIIRIHDSKIKSIVKKHKNTKSICFLGRGINIATALEGRLKLLELSYLPSLAYPAGESKHGFIASIEQGYPTIFIAPKDENHNKIVGNIMEMKARGANIIALIEKGDKKLRNLSDDFLEMPKISDFFTPLIYIVPLQLFAYHMAVESGCDPDKPRNLAKSVTVE